MLPKMSFPYLSPASFQPVMLEVFFLFFTFFELNTQSQGLSALVEPQVTLLHKLALIVLVFTAREEL